MPIHDDTARRLLDHLNGRTALPITGPLKLYIAGTSFAVGYTHTTPQTITLTAAVRGTEDEAWYAENETAVVFPNLPPMKVTNWLIQDSSGTPVTVWTGLTIRDRDVPAGDSYEVPAGALRVRLVDVLDV